jgi:hypothetical protein
MVRVLTFLTNVRIARKKLSATNTLAYLPGASVTKEKVLITSTPIDSFSLITPELGFDRNLEGVVVDVLDVHQLVDKLPVG